ncbi:hypothetical protein EKO04_003103 [Ascochyta lentis]|uniref:SWR1-complex protein 3 domain-containing protein n=1 Tax=Ascochyta lentis TaxID=205686 RepID=A0A8H7J8A8_9PLEO|nr:hypothetical protein EKO04_003103 [Ascochyta lentis]
MDMTEPRRSTRARAREEAAPPVPETPGEKAAKGAKATLKRKRASVAIKDSSTPGTPARDTAPVPPRQTLPLRVADGQALPTLPEPQPLHLSAAEWQNIQQSGVLSASLQRSRAVWVSGVNFRTFHKKHTMPKKMTERTDADKAARARQKEIEKNFPQVGAVDAQLVIEPHTFPIKLYAPKEGSRAAPKKMAPPPQQYGAWPNHSQHSQRSQHAQHSQHGQHTQHAQHPPHYQQYNQPPKQQPPPRPPPPKPVQQAPPQTVPGPASTPAPDPVIHMLAARAGTDPELKAVMKIVAAGQASKDQLEFFQTHINELTEILEKNKKSKHTPIAPPPKQHTPTAPPPKQHTPTAPPPKQSPAPTPPPPRPPHQQQHQPPPKTTPTPTPTPKPFTPAPPQPQQQYAPPQSRPPPPNMYPVKSYSHPPHYQQPPPHYVAPPPPRITYRPLTFEFVEGNGDRFYFPSYSFMEWLPNGSGAKFSFLVTKLKPKPEAAAKPSPTPAPPQTPAPTNEPTPAPANAPTPASTNPPTPAPTNPPTPGAANSPFPPTPTGPTATPTPAPTPSYVAPPRIEDFDERNDLKDIDFYQPVTVLVLTDEHEVKNALPRAIRPPSVVEKYMEEVFDTCKRAEETYLAFRLPKDGNMDADAGARSGDATPSVSTPVTDVAMGGMGSSLGEKRKSIAGRSRKSLV